LIGKLGDPVRIVTTHTGTPEDWTLYLGDEYRNTKLQSNIDEYELLIKSGQSFRVNGPGRTDFKTISDGTLISPTANIIIQIPMKAPENEGDYKISLNIPYYYILPPESIYLGPTQVTWKKTVSVKKPGTSAA
jgi:hypothetical protein